MEELKLSDLNFDADDGSFDMFDENQSDGIKQTEQSKNTNTNGEEIKSPESVAKGVDDNKKNQDSDALKGDGKGGNSSSPEKTLNDTEKLYSTLAAEFKAKGVLSNLDLENEKISSMEDINKALERELQSRLTAKQKLLDEAMSAGVPASEVSKQIEAVESLKRIDTNYVSDVNNVDFRKNLIAQDFINRGYNKDRAITMAQRSIDAGEDVQDALEALNEIISSEEKKIQDLIQSEKTKENEAINGIKTFIEKNEEIIPGVKLTKSQGEELYKSITTDLGNKENAFMRAQREDPLGSRVKLEALFYLTKGLKDFSLFTGKQETKISHSIENLLRGASFTEDGKIETSISDNNSTFTLKSLEGLSFE